MNGTAAVSAASALPALPTCGDFAPCTPRQIEALVRAAALACGAAGSLVIFNDAGHAPLEAHAGLRDFARTRRLASGLAGMIPDDRALELVGLDPAEDGIGFFAGAALIGRDGERVGTLCVVGDDRHQLDDAQRAILGYLAEAVSAAFASDRTPPLDDAAARMLASEDRLRRLYEKTPAMLHSVDPDGVLLAVSDTWLTKMGYARAEVLGRNIGDFLTPDSREYFRSVVFPDFIRTGHCDNAQYRMVTKHGEIIDVLLSAILDRDREGRPLRSLTIIEDVTLRYRAERELTQNSRRLSDIIDATRAGTWQWNVISGAMTVNERWNECLGYGRDDVASMTIGAVAQLIHPGDRARVRSLVRRHLNGKSEYFECELRMRQHGGGWVWVIVRGRVVNRNGSRPEWMFGTLQDITPRKTQEEALRKSQEFLDRTGRLAGVGGWELDLTTQTVHWSDETRRLHGVSADYEPTLESALDFYPAPARAVLLQAVERAAETGEMFDLELPFVRADGRDVWIRTVGSATFIAGKAVRLTGAFQDVTDRVVERNALREATHRMTLATDSGNIGIWDLNLATGELLWDPLMYRLYGLEPSAEPGDYDLWRRHVHPDDVAAVEKTLWETIDSQPFHTEFRVVWPDGSVHFIRASALAMRDGTGRTSRLVGANWDVTESRRLAAELADQHERLRVTLHSIGDAVITTDGTGAVVWLNPAAERMTGWPTADALHKPACDVLHIVEERTGARVPDPISRCLDSGKPLGFGEQIVLRSRDGREFGIENSAAPIRNARGDMLGVVLVFRDVTEARRLSSEMTYRASHDALTGLVNRSEFALRLERSLGSARSRATHAALLYIDLDQFKLVNDACGHAVGDQLLQQVSRLLESCAREGDTLARLGGDEFAMLLDDCSSDRAQRVAQRICERMDQFRFVHDDRRFRVGASIGFVPIDGRWTDTALILQAADASCYAAKEAGRNRVHVWFDTDLAMRERHGETQWTARIEQALEEDAFVLYAQRIEACGSESGSGISGEVLLRMRQPDGSLALPGAFLPAAERFHLASRIDRWVVKAVIARMQAVAFRAAIETLSVNLSGQSVGDRSFHQWVEAALIDAGAEICSKLCFEVAETAAAANFSAAAAFIERVRALGAHVALDDFGAGASSFGYLKTMKVDYLKIDGQFIRDLENDPLSAAAVRCFADVAKVVDVKTVAEFVDRPPARAFINAAGIDYAQGFFIHRPAPLDDLLAARA